MEIFPLWLGETTWSASAILKRFSGSTRKGQNFDVDRSLVFQMGKGSEGEFFQEWQARWWNFNYLIYFHPDPWGNDPIWRAYLSNGLVQPPTSNNDFRFRLWMVSPGFCKKTCFSLGLAIDHWNLISSRKHFIPKPLIIILKTGSWKWIPVNQQFLSMFGTPVPCAQEVQVDQTLPISRESFTWIIPKTILCLVDWTSRVWWWWRFQLLHLPNFNSLPEKVLLVRPLRIKAKGLWILPTLNSYFFSVGWNLPLYTVNINKHKKFFIWRDGEIATDSYWMKKNQFFSKSA